MKTVTVEIINDKVLEILKDLESLKLIRMHQPDAHIDWSKKYKGAMEKQPIDQVDNQLETLRSAWE